MKHVVLENLRIFSSYNKQCDAAVRLLTSWVYDVVCVSYGIPNILAMEGYVVYFEVCDIASKK